ncbi:hypothetical protein IV102_07550 [bacterium]|nr:hypothetical protein [bacterium]
MSDRLEELGVPPKLLAAIRNEVRSNTEQQLNDLWMVVHSLKDATAKESPATETPTLDPAALDEVKAQLESLNQELQKKVRGLRKRFDDQPPFLEQIQQLQQQIQLLQQDLPPVQQQLQQLPALQQQMPQLQQQVEQLQQQVHEERKEQPAPPVPPLILPSDILALPNQMESLLERLDKIERETGQLGGAAALFESRLVDQETRMIRRLDEAEARVRNLVGTARAASSGDTADELSTENLMALAGTVEFSLSDLAKVAIKYNASDLIVRPNSLPYTYLEGDLIPIGQQPLTPTDSFRVTMLALHPNERKQLMKERTFSKLVEYHTARFLLNAYFERGELAVYARRLTPPPVNLDQLDLPRALEVSLLEERGLILLCGGGLGQLKSLAYALLQPINQQRRARIFTLEDAVSYELPEEQSLLSQLQRGIDISQTTDLLRLKPDVLYLQRVATGEELQLALSFASDRTLVIASCPGTGVVNCVQHLLELTSPEHRGGILGQLGLSLRSILCYRHPHPNEYLINSAKVRPWLERGDLSALQTAVETSQPSRGRQANPTAASAAKAPDSNPLPPPSSESLAAIKSPPPPPQPQQTAPTAPSGMLTPPPNMPTKTPPAGGTKPVVSRPPLEPPPEEPPDDKASGGDEETLLGWL